jgi:hypothetical protein
LNKLLKRLTVSLAVCLPITATSLVASPTSASAAKNDCPTNYFCAWDGDNFTGFRAQWAQGIGSQDWSRKGMHDKADSLYNHAVSSETVVDNVQVFRHVNFGDAGPCVRPGETYDVGMDDNDYSSHYWVHSCL